MRLLLLLAVLLAPLTGCRSADKTAAAMAPAPAGAALTDGDPCKTRPARPACCEALTPACNDCRAEAAAAQTAWEQACLSPAATPPDCTKAAPAVDCCGDATDECHSCREQALARLMAWKEACADEDAAACDHRPPQDECCQALIPSCQACQDRNQRVLASWERRCAGASGAAP